MTTSGLVGWLNIRGIVCYLSFSDEIYSNSPTLVTLRVTNRKRLLHSYLLNIRVLDKSLLLTSVQRGKTVTTSFLLTFHRRGLHKLDLAVVSSSFPVNFFIRGIEAPLETELVVFPTPVGTRAEQFSGSTSAGGEHIQPDRGFEGELMTISDYTGVEPLRQIHWRLSARHDWFKVKQFTATANDPVIVDLSADTRLPLEKRLSRATFLINSFGKVNRGIGLKISDGRVIPPNTGRGHRLKLLTELALYDPAD